MASKYINRQTSKSSDMLWVERCKLGLGERRAIIDEFQRRSGEYRAPLLFDGSPVDHEEHNDLSNTDRNTSLDTEKTT